jgi:hypothetical protein
MARSRLAAFVFLVLCALALSAPRAAEPELDVVLVSGEQPGPALWKVSSGGHDLWILGEVSPLPRKVKWRSKQFEHLLANAQEVILHDSSSHSSGSEGAALAHATRLPDKRRLADWVSPELLARVEAVARLFDVHEPLDDLSPSVVGTRLANASLKTLNLQSVPVQVSVEKLARKAKVKITRYSTPRLDIPFEERVESVRQSAVSVCPLESVVRVLEDGGAGLRSLANAWAVGDIDALRRLLPEKGLFTDGNRTSLCTSGVYDGRRQAAGERESRNAPWAAEAERALRENEITLAVVPLPELFATDGYLAAMRTRGYEVVEPN